MKAQCWYKNKEAKITEEAKEANEGLVFIVSGETMNEVGETWLIDSSCSN